MRPPLVLSADGVFPDICWCGDGWLVVYRLLGGPLVLVDLAPDGGERSRQTLDTGSAEDSTFARLATWRARQLLAIRAFRTGGWVAELREVTAARIGPVWPAGAVHNPDHPFGNAPVCLSDEGWFAWQDADTQSVEGLYLATGEASTLRPEIRPTGLSRLVGRQPVFVDEDRASVPGLLNPVWAAGVIVGEDPNGGIRAKTAGREGVLLPGEETMTPRVAAAGDGRFAAVTWGKPGVRFQLFVESELVEPAPPPAPPQPSEPDPTVTIADWQPREGEAPLTVRAVAQLGGGPAGRLRWRARLAGGEWGLAADNPATDPDHSFVFAAPGTFEIGVDVTAPDGRVTGSTAAARRVEVRASTPVPPDPPPPADDRIPAPAALPTRPPFMVGTCWPMSPTEWPATEHLLALRALGLHALRFGLHHWRANWPELLTRIAGAGLRPWPILAIDVAQGAAEIDRLGAFARELFTRAPWVTEVEVENEPSGKMRPEDYAGLVAAVAQAADLAKSEVRIFIAGEVFDFSSGKPHEWFRALQAVLDPSLYYGVALHPYRNPKPPSFSPFGSRRDELAAIRAIVGDKELVVSEVGWQPSSGLEVMGDYVYEELATDQALGFTASFIYAFIGDSTDPTNAAVDFGIFDGDWRARPAALRIAQFLEQQGATS